MLKTGVQGYDVSIDHHLLLDPSGAPRRGLGGAEPVGKYPRRVAERGGCCGGWRSIKTTWENECKRGLAIVRPRFRIRDYPGKPLTALVT